MGAAHVVSWLCRPRREGESSRRSWCFRCPARHYFERATLYFEGEPPPPTKSNSIICKDNGPACAAATDHSLQRAPADSRTLVGTERCKCNYTSGRHRVTSDVFLYSYPCQFQ